MRDAKESGNVVVEAKGVQGFCFKIPDFLLYNALISIHLTSCRILSSPFIHAGVTGYLLVLVIITLYIFAVPYARRYLFRTFWITHHLYVALYILLILHGSGRLVQPPLFQWFFIVPASFFAIDKLISYSRKKVRLPIGS